MIFFVFLFVWYRKCHLPPVQQRYQCVQYTRNQCQQKSCVHQHKSIDRTGTVRRKDSFSIKLATVLTNHAPFKVLWTISNLKKSNMMTRRVASAITHFSEIDCDAISLSITGKGIFWSWKLNGQVIQWTCSYCTKHIEILQRCSIKFIILCMLVFRKR